DRSAYFAFTMLRVFVVFHSSFFLCVSDSTASSLFCSDKFNTTPEKSLNHRYFRRCRDPLHRRPDYFHGLCFLLRTVPCLSFPPDWILQISKCSDRTLSYPDYEDSFSPFRHSRSGSVHSVRFRC